MSYPPRSAMVLGGMGIVLVPILIVAWWLFRHHAVPAPTREALLSNPTIRDWLHALSEEEREVDSLQRQAATPSAPALSADENLAQERVQLQRIWMGLYGEWIADGGRAEDCPGYERYRGLLKGASASP